MAEAEFGVRRRSRQEKRRTLLAKKVDEVGQWSELEARPCQEKEITTEATDPQRQLGDGAVRRSQETSLPVAAFGDDTRKHEEMRTSVISDASEEVDISASSLFAQAEELSHNQAKRNSILKTPHNEIGQPPPEDTSQLVEDESEQEDEIDSSPTSLFVRAEEASHTKARKSLHSVLKLHSVLTSLSKSGQPQPRDVTQGAEQRISLITRNTQDAEDAQEERRQVKESTPERLRADDAMGYNAIQSQTKPSQFKEVLGDSRSTRPQDSQVAGSEFGSFAGPRFRHEEIQWKVEALMNDVVNGGSLNDIAEGLIVFDDQVCSIVAQVLLSRVAKNVQSSKIYAAFVSRAANNFPSVAGQVTSQTFLTAIRRTCWSEFSQLIEILISSPTQRLLHHTRTYGILGFIAELFNLGLISIEYVEDAAQAILQMSLLPPTSENCIGCMCDFLQLTFRVLPKVAGGPDFILRMSKQLRSLSITRLPLQARAQIDQLLDELGKLDNVTGRFAPILLLSQPISWASLDAV